MNEFYIICPIGLEKLVLKEIEFKGLKSALKIKLIDKGGIEIACGLSLGLSLNNLLKTPTRILLRLKKQKCRDFPKLFKIISKLELNPYLVQEKLDFKVSTNKSRIINTKKAIQTCEDAFKDYLNGNAIKETTLKANKNADVQKIYIRIDHDDMTISLDTSGEALHIRGNKQLQGHAPMRESYAAFLLTSLVHRTKEIETLIDPMCGSGTFLTEALTYNQQNKRSYVYERWPILRKKVQPKTSSEFESLFPKLVGFDRDVSVLSKVKGIEFSKEDLFEGEPQDFPNNAIIINPPYGKRVKISGDRLDFYNNIITRLKEKFSPKVIGIVIPANVPFPHKHELEFNNNGIKVKFYLIF